MTLRADGLAAVTGQHDTVLSLVLVLGDHVEEVVNACLVPAAFILAASAAVPEVILLLLSQLLIRCEYREVVLLCMQDEIILPSGHHISAPTNYGTVIYAQRTVGNDQ